MLLWCRYKQDPITLQLKEYISPEVEAAQKAEVKRIEDEKKAAEARLDAA